MTGGLSIPDGNDSLAEYTARVLAPWSPIIVSNRAPYEPGPNGQLRKGSGGLVTALLTVAEATAAPWVACARTPAERELATKLGVPLIGQVPLVSAVREGGDIGVPIVVSDPDSEAARAFEAIASWVEAKGPKRRFRPELTIR